MAVAPEDIQTTFDSNSRKYRCCFQCCCHVRVCAKIIGIVEVSFISIIFISSLIGYVNHRTISINQTSSHTHHGKEHWPRGVPPADHNQSTIANISGEPSHGEEPTDPEVQFAICTFFFIVVWIVVILLLYGIKNTKPKGLLPHLFLQGLSIVYTLIMTVVYAVQQGKPSPLTLPPKPALVIYVMATILAVYFFVCVYRCYCYLKAKKRAAPMCRLQKTQITEEEGAGSPV